MKVDQSSKKEINSFSGACFLIKTSLIRKLGQLFDESFFCYFEETDLRLRVQRLGSRIATAPDALVYHKEHGSQVSSDFSQYQMARNRFLVERNNVAVIPKIFFLIFSLLIYFPLRVLGFWIAQKNSKHFVSGFAAGLKVFFGKK